MRGPEGGAFVGFISRRIICFVLLLKSREGKSEGCDHQVLSAGVTATPQEHSSMDECSCGVVVTGSAVLTTALCVSWSPILFLTMHSLIVEDLRPGRKLFILLVVVGCVRDREDVFL